MANTFSQIYLQFVFAVKNRQSLIPKEHREELNKYITGLVQHRKAKLLAVNCMPDHVHIFTGFKPVISISDFVKEIKVMSSLTQKVSAKKNLVGRKVTACSPIHIHILIRG